MLMTSGKNTQQFGGDPKEAENKTMEMIQKVNSKQYGLLSADKVNALKMLVKEIAQMVSDAARSDPTKFNKENVVQQVLQQKHKLTKDGLEALTEMHANPKFDVVVGWVFKYMNPEKKGDAAKPPGTTTAPNPPKSEAKLSEEEENAIKNSIKEFPKNKWNINAFLIVDSSMNDKNITVKAVDYIFQNICNRTGPPEPEQPPAITSEDGETTTDDKRKRKRRIAKLFFIDDESEEMKTSKQLSMNDIIRSLSKNSNFEPVPLKSFKYITKEQTIDLVVRIADGEKDSKYDVEYLLYMGSLTGEKVPYVINRAKYNSYKGSEFSYPKGTQDVIQKLRAIIARKEGIKNPDFTTSREHDSQIDAIQAELRKNPFIKSESVTLLVDYKMNVTATAQQNEKVKLEFEMQEGLLQLSNNIRRNKFEKGLKAFIIDPKTDKKEDILEKEELWHDMAIIPVNISMLVVSEYVDYDILGNLMKLLEFTKHKLTQLFISKKAYDSDELRALDLKSKFVTVTFFDEGGLYELLQDKIDFNLVVDFSRKQDTLKLSQLMINQHYLKNHVSNTGFFVMDPFYNLVFHIKVDLTTDLFPDNVNDIQSVYTSIIQNIELRKKALIKSDIETYNQSIDILEKEVTTRLAPISGLYTNDFLLYKNFYLLTQVSTQQQNKNVIDKLKVALTEKRDSEFYRVIASLADSEDSQGSQKLNVLSKLPSSIDVLLLNYNNTKKDFISLVNDLLTSSRINTLYVQKADMTDEIANLLSPANIVTYTNVYELFQKMAMSNRKEVNIDLVVNASVEGKLTTSQKVVSTSVLKDESNAYISIGMTNGSVDVHVYSDPTPLDIDGSTQKTIEDLKTFGRLLQTKKIGNDLVEFNEIVETLKTKNDPDMAFFLDRATAQPIKPVVFTDDLKALTTLLQERENEKLSNFITANFDQFRNAIKTLPQDNTIMVLDFQDAFSTFESAMKTARFMLKGVERNIVKAFHHLDASNIRDKLIEYMNLTDSTTIAFSSFKQLYELTSKSDKVKLIIKGTSLITPATALFFRVLVQRGENPLVLLFDFDNQTITIKTASDLLSNIQYTSEQLDELYMAFNVIEAIKSKLLSLNENGQRYYASGKGGKAFDKELFVRELNELNGIIKTFDIDVATQNEFAKVLNEYSDTLMTIELMEKLNNKESIISKLYEITEDYSSLKKYSKQDQVDLTALINKLYITFAGDKDLAKPGLLKYRQIIKTLEEQDYKLESKSLKAKKGPQELSLDYYIRKGFIQEARDKYKRGINDILSNPSSLTFQKLNVLRKLLDNLYKLQYGADDVSAGKDEVTRNKFKRFVVAPDAQYNYYAAYQADVIIETLKYNAQQNTSQIAKLIDDKNMNKTSIVNEVVRILFLNIAKNPKLDKSPYYQLLRDTIEDNVYVLVNNVSRIWSSYWRWIPFIDAKNKEETKKNLLTHYFFDRHIIPVFIDREHLLLPFGQFGQVPCDENCISNLNLLSPSGIKSIKLLPDGITPKSGMFIKQETDLSEVARVASLASYFVDDYGVLIDENIDNPTRHKENIQHFKPVIKVVLETAEKNLPLTQSAIDVEQKKLRSLPKNSLEALRQERVIAPLEKNKKLYLRSISILKRMMHYFDIIERFLTAKEKGEVPQELIEEVRRYNDRVNNVVSSNDSQPQKPLTLEEFEALPRAPDASKTSIVQNNATVYGFSVGQKDLEIWYKDITNKLKANITTTDDLSDIKNDYITNGYRLIKNELLDIVYGHMDSSTGKPTGGVSFMLMEDVFAILSVILNDLIQTSPDLESNVKKLQDLVGKIKETLKNPALASIYFINTPFQREVIDNQFWMQLLLRMNNPTSLSKLVEDNETVIDRKVGELLKEYERICESIRNSDSYRQSQGYISEIVVRKHELSNTSAKVVSDDDILLGGGSKDGDEADNEEIKHDNDVQSNTNVEIREETDVVDPPLEDTETINLIVDSNSQNNHTEEAVVEPSGEMLQILQEPQQAEAQTIQSQEQVQTHSLVPKEHKEETYQPPKDPIKAEIEDFRSTELFKILDHVKKPNKAKAYLESVYTSGLGNVPIKKINVVSPPSTSFQFGGGFLWNRDKKTADVQKQLVDSNNKIIPAFKPDVVVKPFKANLSDGEDVDFEHGVNILFGTDPELVRLLIAYNKKQQQLLDDEPIDEKVSIRQQLANVANNHKAFREYFDVINEDDVDTTIENIKSIIRPGMSKMLDDAKYDVSRVSKQIKSQPPLPLNGSYKQEIKPVIDIPIENETEKEPQSLQTDKQAVNEEVSKEFKPTNEFDYVPKEYQAQQAYVQSAVKTIDVEKPKLLQSMTDKITNLVSNVSFAPLSSGGSSDSRLPNLTQTHLYIQEVLTDMDNFYKKMQRKQSRWADEINTMLNQGDVSLHVQIQTKVNMLGGGKLLEIERRKVSIQLLYLMKKFIRVIVDKSTVNYGTFKDYFFHDKRTGVRAILDYLKQFAFVKDDLFVAKFNDDEKLKQKAHQLRETFIKIETTFMNYIKSFHSMNDIYYKALSEVLEDTIADSFTINMRDKERSQIIAGKRDLLTQMQELPNKIKSFYTLNYPVTEMFDAQFLIMYIIKAVRIVSFQFSMNMATNVFIQKYNNVVYDKKTNPPSLINYMMIFLGFDLFFNVFILILLGLCGFLFKTENNTFPIDGYLYKKFGFDYIVSTIVIILNGILIGNVVKQKKYFRYKTEGERGIRAFEEMMKMSATVITLLPLFMIVSG